MRINEDYYDEISRDDIVHIPDLIDEEIRQSLLHFLDDKYHPEDGRDVDLSVITYKKPLLMAEDAEQLSHWTNKYINHFGNKCDLNWIDTSQIIDFSALFRESKFNGNISMWNVSNGITFRTMFEHSKFNSDISSWNTSSAKDMSYMFSDSKFNKPIGKWDVSKVTDMENMFSYSVFD